MNLEYLNYFLETADTCSVSQTALNVHVSASAVSQGIANLEHELGIKLFHRTKKKLVLTKEGESLLQETREVLNGAEKIKQLAKRYTESPAEVIQIATVPGMTASLTDTLLARTRFFPNVTWELLEIDMAEILAKCQADEISMGFIAFSDVLATNYRGLAAHRLVKSEIKALVAADSVWAGHEAISLDDLAKQPLAIYKDSFNLSILKQLQRTYGTVDVRLISNHLNAVTDLVLNGAAISISPEHLIANNRYLPTERMTLLPIEGVAYPSTYLWAVHSHVRALSQLEASFLEAAATAIRQSCLR